MFNKDKYGKILVPMVTPFKKDQSVDYKAAVSIARKLVDDKLADSLVLTGTTGKFFTMTFEKRVEMFRVIKEAVDVQLPLIAATGCASTPEIIALSKKAEELGYELIMVVAPYYTKPNQEQLYNHYQKVAKSVNVDILVYNIPIFTGVNVNPKILTEWAKIKYPGHELRVGEVLEKQKELYIKLGVQPPTSLWVGENPGVKRAGSDVTIITWSRQVLTALKAARELEREGVIP